MPYRKIGVMAIMAMCWANVAMAEQYYHMESEGVAVSLMERPCPVDRTGQMKLAIMKVDSNTVLGCYLINNRGNAIVKWSDGEVFELLSSWFHLRTSGPRENFQARSEPSTKKEGGADKDQPHIPPPHQVGFSNGIVKYPLGLSSAALERYIPNMRCSDFNSEIICSAESGELAAIFVRGVSCVVTEEVRFFIRQGGVVGAACRIDRQQADAMEAAFSSDYGQPHLTTQTAYDLTYREKVWIYENEELKIINVSGKNIQGAPVNNYSISVGIPRSGR